MTLRVLDLFSGIGGFSLGLERTGGFETVAFCEIEPFPRAVLKKHWPDVPRFHDVKRLRGRKDAFIGYSTDIAELFVRLAGPIDVICGGFPCQDISLAGKGAGLAGERSGLWSEYHRLIKEVQPRYAIIENVSALRSRGLDQVLGSLAAVGYDAEWHCIPASAVGAPHQRDRIWVVAYPNERGLPEQGVCSQQSGGTKAVGAGEAVAHTDSESAVRYSGGAQAEHPLSGNCDQDFSDPGGHPPERLGSRIGEVSERDWWRAEPDVGRMAHGVPSRVDRLRALGNAVVPQIPEIIGQAILAFERSKAVGQAV